MIGSIGRIGSKILRRVAPILFGVIAGPGNPVIAGAGNRVVASL
jgi:hypothetical protein